MARYLVIAHQTAESYELSEVLQEKAKQDAAAEFTLLVPITYAGFLMFPRTATTSESSLAPGVSEKQPPGA
jgi:hypothetical protein